MYLHMTLWLLSWPILIYVSYLIASFAIKKLKD